MKKLENFGVQELNATELQEINGGVDLGGVIELVTGVLGTVTGVVGGIVSVVGSIVELALGLVTGVVDL
ncbi:hypothetical protein [Sinomicrobium weinanense]|uniref:Bacteriocin n=1 Tax=Sinomicrobium weinanense TaxID=2842200 RepID=A0A926JNJ3_9FLAO|nr:hypothetical protein [Sinomicrobium weinanense]MBC9794397.1 hypothetical protein [Sinomicrobium weinanense]MBU3124304.1 hypothetical protein [Sinomicrobium weinanense]